MLQTTHAALTRAAADSNHNDNQAAWSAAERIAGVAYERSWEKLHCGAWKEVASAWREAFALAAVMRVRLFACLLCVVYEVEATNSSCHLRDCRAGYWLQAVCLQHKRELAECVKTLDVVRGCCAFRGRLERYDDSPVRVAA